MKRKLNCNEVNKVRNLYLSGLTLTDLENKFSITYTALRRIINFQTYTECELEELSVEDYLQKVKQIKETNRRKGRPKGR